MKLKITHVLCEVGHLGYLWQAAESHVPQVPLNVLHDSLCSLKWKKKYINIC